MSTPDQVVLAALTEAGVAFEQPKDHVFVVTLIGVRKLKTTLSLAIGTQSVSINAFVARRPDENHEDVYRWLLERNRRMYLVAFSIDHLGDIYLTGKIPLSAVTPEVVDQILGVVLEYSDSSFNTILELGFATAIKREWQWRTERGESTENLEAFRHLAEGIPSDPAG
jgi:hypothetical protein